MNSTPGAREIRRNMKPFCPSRGAWAVPSTTLQGFSTSNYKKIENRKEAIHYALQKSQKDDVILIAGKGHEDYQIIGTEKTHFSDYEVVIKGMKL